MGKQTALSGIYSYKMCVIFQWILLFLRIQDRKIAPVILQKILSS